MARQEAREHVPVYLIDRGCGHHSPWKVTSNIRGRVRGVTYIGPSRPGDVYLSEMGSDL